MTNMVRLVHLIFVYLIIMLIGWTNHGGLYILINIQEYFKLKAENNKLNRKCISQHDGHKLNG